MTPRKHEKPAKQTHATEDTYSQLKAKWLAPAPIANEKTWLMIIVIGALAIRIIAGLMHGLHADRDGVAFALQAIELAQGRWAYWFYIHGKPPVFSFLAAGPIALGIDAILSVRIISIVFGVIMLHPAWLLLGRVTRGRVRLIALAVVAFCLLEVRISGRTMSDTTYATILLYAFYFSICRGLLDGKTKGFLIGGLLAGIAFLTRSEAVIYLPLIPAIAIVAAWRKIKTWPLAFASLLLPIIATAVIAPQIALLSQHEGHFLIRRNATQFVSSSVDDTKLLNVQDGAENGTSQSMGKNILATAEHLGDYLIDKIPRALGYVPMLFLIIGLIFMRRKLVSYSPECLFIIIFAWTILALSPMDAHTRFMTPVIPMIAPAVAIGIVLLLAKIIAINPLRLGKVKQFQAEKYILAILLLCVIIPAGQKILSRDYHEDHELYQAGDIIRRAIGQDTKPSASVICSSGMIAYKSKLAHEVFNSKWRMNTTQVKQYLITKPNGQFWVIQNRYLKVMAPELKTAQPDWLTLLDVVTSHPKAHEKRVFYIFRINRDFLIP